MTDKIADQIRAMTPDMEKAYAEAYPDRVPEYVNHWRMAMIPENEALIAEAEHVRDWMKRQDLKFSWQTVDNLIAALRAADERERDLDARAAVLFGNCFDYGAQCQKAQSFLIVTPRGSEDARSHIVKKAVQALRGKS